jgi:hypothetical protein
MPNVKVQMKSKAHMTKFMLKENLTLRPFGICLPAAGRDYDICNYFKERRCLKNWKM